MAAAVPVAGCTDLQGLREPAIWPACPDLWRVGGVGTFAVQIAKALGAEVTGVCSARNVDLVQSLGADHVIDYAQQDFTHAGRRYDLIFDAVATGRYSVSGASCVPLERSFLSARRRGRWLGPLAPMLKANMLSRFTRQRLVSFFAQHIKEDLLTLKELIEAGKVKPVIDRTYPLSEVPKAIGYLETGHARGKVVITI